MSIQPIRVIGTPVLRQKAKRLTTFDRAFQRLVDDMIETMQAAPGVGLAGPQVGVPFRVAVLDIDDQILVIVNPEISRWVGHYTPNEGCLSVPGFHGYPTRAERVSVRAKDRFGHDFRINNAEGHLAQALQHEIDHLDGCLYIDRITDLEDLTRRVIKQPRNESTAEQSTGWDTAPVKSVTWATAWQPTEQEQFDQVTLPLKAGELWLKRGAAPVVSYESGQGCRMDDTHPGKPCAYGLEVRNRVIDGRCLTAKTEREEGARPSAPA